MKKFICFVIVFSFLKISSVFSQNVAITDDDVYTANSSAMLDVKSLSKGFLTPRLTTAQRNAIVTPATGLLVFDTSLNGFYYYNGSAWINLSSGSSSGLLWSYNSPNVYLTGTSDKVGIGTSAPAHKLMVSDNVTLTDGTDGSFIDIQNQSNSTGVLSGIRFYNGTTANTYKGGIFYKDALSNGRGDLILANNSVNSATNVTTTDSRLTIKNNGGIEVKATSGAAANASLFHVLNATGDTIFAVYDGGVRVNVYDDPLVKATGSKGGFAVGGFSPAKGTMTNEYLRITPDSIRMYIEEGAASKATGSKGGFAVGGFSPAKATPSDYFNIYGATAPTTINPSEARIFWYPLKEAFLAGRVLVQSPDSVGLNSFSTGFESKAIGNYSQAFGYHARAKGNNSTAIGNNASAEGTESYALGNYSKTTKTGSYAIGSGAKASGLNSFALGSTGVDSAGVATDATKALGDYSYAFGMGSISSGKGAFSFGTQNTSAGDYSTTIGYKNTSNSYNSICLGSNNSSDGWIGFGIAIGTNNVSSGGFGLGVALGWDNNVSGSLTSAAIGYKNIVNGLNSFAIGANSDVQANNSVLFNLDGVLGGTTSATITQDNTFSIMSGLVGIGTTAPTNRLEVLNPATSTTSNSYCGYFSSTAGTTSGTSYGLRSYSKAYGTSSSYAVYANATGGSTSGSEWAFYGLGDGYFSGNVGIGSAAMGTHKLFASSSTGGVAGSTVSVVNSASNGLAMIIENSSASSSDNVVLITQKGSTGDLMSMDSYHGVGSWDREFRFTNLGSGLCDGSWTGGGADYAEYFIKDDTTKQYEPGDVILMSSAGRTVITDNEPYSNKVVGVYSTNPVVIGNGSSEGAPANSVLVGMMGVVPTKVCNENGKIEVGDFLTTSSIPGVAMKADKPCLIIGRSMENFDESTVGKIDVLVNPTWAGNEEQIKNQDLRIKKIESENEKMKAEIETIKTLLNPSAKK